MISILAVEVSFAAAVRRFEGGETPSQEEPFCETSPS